MKFRFYYEVLGGHVHVRVFAGQSTSMNLGKCGDLTFRHDEWLAFTARLRGTGIEVIPEEANRV